MQKKIQFDTPNSLSFTLVLKPFHKSANGTVLRILHFENAVFVQCEPFHAFTKEDRQRKTMLLKNIVNRTKKVNELSLLDQEDEYISCTQTRRFTDKSCQP